MVAGPRSWIGVVAVVTSVLLASASPSAAGPVEQRRAEANAMAGKLAEQARRITELDRSYRQAQARAAEAEAALARGTALLAGATARQSEARRRLVAHAQQAYVLGGAVSFLGRAATGRINDGVVRRDYLRFLTMVDRESIGQFRAATEDLTTARTRLASARAQARARADAIAAERGRLAGAVSQQRALLGRVNADVARMIAAEQARRDASSGSPTVRRALNRPSPPSGGGSGRSGLLSVEETFRCIRQLESGNNYRSHGGGAYQFQDATWQSLGYKGSATDASPEVQDEAALKLFSQRGFQPWTTAPLCGRV